MGLYKASTTLLTNLDYDISNIKEIPKRISANQMKLTYTDMSNHKQSDIVPRTFCHIMVLITGRRKTAFIMPL